jgi:hypothetical protein
MGHEDSSMLDFVLIGREQVHDAFDEFEGWHHADSYEEMCEKVMAGEIHRRTNSPPC